MIPKEIFKKVRNVEIRTKGLVNDLFGGKYQSIFKGQGMTFSEVREYSAGDDIRMIDWNVTARNNGPYIKILEEERELTVYLLVDISASGDFGSINRLKSDIIAEVAAILSFSATKNKDKVGLILFSEEVEKFIPPQKNRSHVLRVIREILFHKPSFLKTDISKALNFLMQVSKRRSIVFVISDFIDKGFWKPLKIINKKNDLIGIKISDPAELNFPNIGLFKIFDEENNQEHWINSNSKAMRNSLSIKIKNNFKKFRNKCKKDKIDLIEIDTAEDYVGPIINYFKKRGKK
ncbi:MAG: DUF58 domain-containing protein [bacterium TMED144]|nr:MAG: DUF58 domain-containing protein [bacterium TMED144]